MSFKLCKFITTASLGMLTSGLVACGGGEARSVSLSGSVQKGPFVAGSTINVSFVDARGIAIGQPFSTSTTSNLGDFKVDFSTNGPVSLEGVGFYYNEATGKLSGNPLTLRAFYDPLESGAQEAHINLITHLSYERIKVLLAQGVPFADAVTQSESALRTELGLSAAPTLSKPGVKLNLLGGDNDESAYLLAVSVIVAQAAKDNAGLGGPIDAAMQELLGATAFDLADDGKLSATLSAQYRDVQRNLIPEPMIDLLKARLVQSGSSAAVPDINRVLDSDGDGVFNIKDSCPLIANVDQSMVPPGVCKFRPQFSPLPGAMFSPIDLIPLVVTQQGGRAGVMYFRRNGGENYAVAVDADGLLSAPRTFTLPAGGPPYMFYSALAPGDLDGDGATDVLATSGYSMTLPEGLYLTGSTAGFASFKQTVSYPYPMVDTSQFMGFGVSSYPTAVAVADFDKNGSNDMAGIFGEQQQNRRVAVQRQTAPGQWATPTYITGQPSFPTQAFDVVAGDVNKDGNADLVVGGTFGVQTLLGDGLGGFAVQPATAACIGASCPMDIALADFDQDGNLDLLLLRDQMIPMTSDQATIGVMMGSASGSFGPVSSLYTLSPGVHAWKVFAGDLDGNGRPDIAFSLGEGPISRMHVIVSTAAGFAPPQLVRLPCAFGNLMEVIKLNSDNKHDLLLSCLGYGTPDTTGLLRMLIN